MSRSRLGNHHSKLSDLDPGFGDLDLRENGRKVVSRVLDTILSPPGAADRQVQLSSMQTEQPGANPFTIDTSEDANMPEGLTMTDHFDYDMSTLYAGPDHVFRL